MSLVPFLVKERAGRECYIHEHTHTQYGIYTKQNNASVCTHNVTTWFFWCAYNGRMSYAYRVYFRPPKKSCCTMFCVNTGECTYIYIRIKYPSTRDASYGIYFCCFFFLRWKLLCTLEKAIFPFGSVKTWVAAKCFLLCLIIDYLCFQ